MPVECKHLHLFMVYKKDAAEQHHLYMNVTFKKQYSMTIKSYYKRLEEIDALVPSLPYLKDQHDCPSEIECTNLSLTPVNMCNLLMRSVSGAVKDEYN